MDDTTYTATALLPSSGRQDTSHPTGNRAPWAAHWQQCRGPWQTLCKWRKGEKQQIQINIKLNKPVSKVQHCLSLGLSVTFIQDLLKVQAPSLILVSYLFTARKPKLQPQIGLLNYNNMAEVYPNILLRFRKPRFLCIPWLQTQLHCSCPSLLFFQHDLTSHVCLVIFLFQPRRPSWSPRWLAGS